MENNFEASKAELERKPKSAAAIMELLKCMRVHRIRDSRLVVRFGGAAVRKMLGQLGDDKWAIYEQVFIAALDTGDDELANDCLAALMVQFKDSSRVKRLVGLQSEAKREFKAASETYDELLEANPCNALALKRRVALLLGQGKAKEAVRELNDLLEQYHGDATAWQCLADLYLGMSKYDAAAFCFEELLLHDPMNHMLHCRLGEVYFTLGRPEDLANARKYFAQSLEVKTRGNVRALHGLAACCAAVAEDPKRSGRAEVNRALHEHASSELRALYRKQCPDLMPRLEATLDEQRASIGR
jgi:predicted Zn-dependent protease